MSVRSVQLLLGVTAACLLTYSQRTVATEDDYGEDDDYGDREEDREYTPRRHEEKGGLVNYRDDNFGEKHVGVHVPVFYKMNLDKDRYDGRKNLGIDVLRGLVKVRVKKDPYEFQDKKVFVSVGGLPLWNRG